MKKKKLIAFIGPMCVGKSTISKIVGKKMNLPVVSFDLLVFFANCMSRYELEKIPSFNDWRKIQLVNFKSSLNSAEYQQRKEQVEEEIKNLYDTLVQYEKICHLSTLTTEACAMEVKKIFSNPYTFKDICFSHIVCELDFLDAVLNKVKQPVIFDLSGGMGSIFTPDSDLNIGGELFSAKKTFEDKQDKILKRFDKIVYIEPGRGFKERSHNKKVNSANKFFIKSKKSFMKYADITITTNDLFTDSASEVFIAERNDYDLKQKEKFETLLNAPEVNHIASEIVDGIQNLDKAREL